MERTIYSCDWCSVDASSAGSIDDGWEVRESPSQKAKVVLCRACFKAACEAWERARARRFKEAHEPAEPEIDATRD